MQILLISPVGKSKELSKELGENFIKDVKRAIQKFYPETMSSLKMFLGQRKGTETERIYIMLRADEGYKYRHIQAKLSEDLDVDLDFVVICKEV